MAKISFSCFIFVVFCLLLPFHSLANLDVDVKKCLSRQNIDSKLAIIVSVSPLNRGKVKALNTFKRALTAVKPFGLNIHQENVGSFFFSKV